jgi:hypothetical protein
MKNLTAVLQIIGTQGNQLFGAGAVGAAGTTSITPEILDKLWFYRFRRNGNATPETVRHSAGIAPPFHHLVDPGTVASKFWLIWENVVQAAVAAGDCRVFAGLTQWITPGVATTLLGVGFYADPADNLWHCYVHDCPTGLAPITVRRNTATAKLMTDIHRLKIIFDGAAKTIKWYIDNVVVDTWTPAAPLDRMSSLTGTRFAGDTAHLTGPEVHIGAFVPANGDVIVRGYAGSPPLIRTVFAATPAITPGSSGTHMMASVI